MMSNNLVKVEDDFQEENEINIYDLINIFLKNIKLFVIVSILGVVISCIYVAKRIIFDKNNTIYINYTLNYQEINSYIGKDIYYPKKSPKEILLDNKYIELLFENPELKALYEEKVKKDRDSIDTKRQFLINNKILETSSIKELTKNEAEKELLEKTEKTLFKNLTLYAEGLKQGIEQFKQNERKAEAGLYPYNNLLYQLPKWFNDESILFETQTEINFLQKKESMNLFAVILIGGILLTAGYYTLSFMSQSKKTK